MDPQVQDPGAAAPCGPATHAPGAAGPAGPSTGTYSQPFSRAIRTASARLRAASFWIAMER